MSPPAVVAVQSNKVYLAQEAFMVCFSITARKINVIRYAAPHALRLFDPLGRAVATEGDPLRTFGFRGDD